MTALDLSALLLVSAGLGVAAVWVVMLWLDLRQQRQIEADRLKPGEPAIRRPGETIIPISPWSAMPGNRIELGATGFYIEHRPNDPEFAYWLWSPEGRLVARGGPFMLRGLKGIAEQMHADRREFEPPEGGWKL